MKATVLALVCNTTVQAAQPEVKARHEAKLNGENKRELDRIEYLIQGIESTKNTVASQRSWYRFLISFGASVAHFTAGPLPPSWLDLLEHMHEAAFIAKLRLHRFVDRVVAQAVPTTDDDVHSTYKS